ncbi:hypothetical protein [Nocardia alba]|uniref:Uncharacterized protein n=1 Tax=Nocardia alba TaxID=225051 RepID=A0A4R1F1U9_9NOCA|nr:hypothetical protein [Nocardia alba]TCJ88107.1 hypothetical protein DFR71_6649 [Nocardia alba]
MNIPTTRRRDIWRRAAAPTIPVVYVADGHMVSEVTAHHADVTVTGRWVVDYLPGRHLTREQAMAALQIAIAPDKPEVERWSATLGLTSAEALGYLAMSVGV